MGVNTTKNFLEKELNIYLISLILKKNLKIFFCLFYIYTSLSLDDFVINIKKIQKKIFK